MSKKNQITDLIDGWGETRRAFAEDTGANLPSVHKWAKTGRIPSGWQNRVVRAAQAKGKLEITGDWMIAAHEDLQATQ